MKGGLPSKLLHKVQHTLFGGYCTVYFQYPSKPEQSFVCLLNFETNIFSLMFLTMLV